MKKKITAIVLVVLVLALLTMGMTLAYFTDEKEAQNVFVFGDISIDLEEPGWKPGEDGGEDDTVMEDIFPGMDFTKDPYIVNTGDADAYVRMGVEINPAVLQDLTGGTDEAALAKILKGLSGAGWTFDRMDTTADGTIVFWYNYGVLGAKAQTSALFTAVHIPEDYKSDNVETIMGEGRIFGINVIAQAIQTVGFNSAEEAYAALDAEYQH